MHKGIQVKYTINKNLSKIKGNDSIEVNVVAYLRIVTDFYV